MVNKKQPYSFLTGIKKSLKNVIVIAGIPAVVFLIDNWTEWIPNEYNAIAAPIIGFLAYLVKNYRENK